MYQLITSKGRKSSESLADLAEWLLEHQPASTRIVQGDLETEVEWFDATCEADRLDLAVNNDTIYLAGFDGGRGGMVYLRFDADCITLVDGTTTRTVTDDETLADLLAAFAQGC